MFSLDRFYEKGRTIRDLEEMIQKRDEKLAGITKTLSSFKTDNILLEHKAAQELPVFTPKQIRELIDQIENNIEEAK